MITTESTTATRRWFADNALACIADAESGAVKVNNLPAYIARQRKHHDDALAGAYDHTFAHRQRAQYIQTGTCTPLLGGLKKEAA